MAYTLDYVLSLGSTQTGLTLRAALIDSAGSLHASLKDITAGFVELGAGHYLFHCAALPDSHRGAIVFYTGALGAADDFAGVTVLAAGAINPQEAEHSDAKVSSVGVSSLTPEQQTTLNHILLVVQSKVSP